MPPPQRRAADDGPGLAEVVRILEELRAEFRESRVEMRSTYVRKDVYEAERKADLQVVAELRGDLDVIAEQQQWTRRAAITGVVLPIVVAVFLAVLLAAVGLQ